MCIRCVQNEFVYFLYWGYRMFIKRAWQLAMVWVVAVSLAGCKPVPTVSSVDIPRYMGLWYQVGAYETSFNKGLVGVTAEYTLMADGSVQVYNKGYKDSLTGPLDEILGKAVVVDKNTNAKLKVSFPGVPNLPFSNYWIVQLDSENYQYAVVSDPFRFTLFILSRTPQIDAALYASIKAKLVEQGFNVAKIIDTPQPIFQ